MGVTSYEEEEEEDEGVEEVEDVTVTFHDHDKEHIPILPMNPKKPFVSHKFCNISLSPLWNFKQFFQRDWIECCLVAHSWNFLCTFFCRSYCLCHRSTGKHSQPFSFLCKFINTCFCLLMYHTTSKKDIFYYNTSRFKFC